MDNYFFGDEKKGPNEDEIWYDEGDERSKLKHFVYILSRYTVHLRLFTPFSSKFSSNEYVSTKRSRNGLLLHSGEFIESLVKESLLQCPGGLPKIKRGSDFFELCR